MGSKQGVSPSSANRGNVVEGGAAHVRLVVSLGAGLVVPARSTASRVCPGSYASAPSGVRLQGCGYVYTWATVPMAVRRRWRHDPPKSNALDMRRLHPDVSFDWKKIARRLAEKREVCRQYRSRRRHARRPPLPREPFYGIVDPLARTVYVNDPTNIMGIGALLDRLMADERLRGPATVTDDRDGEVTPHNRLEADTVHRSRVIEASVRAGVVNDLIRIHAFAQRHQASSTRSVIGPPAPVPRGRSALPDFRTCSLHPEVGGREPRRNPIRCHGTGRTLASRRNSPPRERKFWPCLCSHPGLLTVGFRFGAAAHPERGEWPSSVGKKVRL